MPKSVYRLKFSSPQFFGFIISSGDCIVDDAGLLVAPINAEPRALAGGVAVGDAEIAGELERGRRLEFERRQRNGRFHGVTLVAHSRP